MPKTRPQDGDTNWGEILNSHLAQTLGENGGINTSNTDPALTSDDEGYTYINTSTGEIKQWDGSSWNVLLTETTDSTDLNYDNTSSGLSATSTQGAIDEIAEEFDYIQINSTGTIAEATGSDAVAIGKSTTASGINSVAIGDGADSNSTGAIAILGNALGQDAVSIGDGSLATNRGVAVGSDTYTNIGTVASIAVGSNAAVSSDSAIAIGNNTTIAAASDNSIVLGNSANSSVINGVAIGTNAAVTGGASSSIVIGQDSSSTAFDNILIGRGITSNRVGCILIGRDASTTFGLKSVAIGEGAHAGAASTVSIGVGSIADAAGAAQIGTGTNNSVDTLQYKDNRLADQNGLYTAHTATNYSPSSANNIDSHLAAIDTELASVGGDPYIDINSSGSQPTANGNNAVAIGSGAQTAFDNNISIGTGAITTNSFSAIAIGQNANGEGQLSVSIGSGATALNNGGVSIGNGANSTGGSGAIAIGRFASSTAGGIQLGTGTNPNSNTLQYLSNTIANSTSIQLSTQSTGTVPASTPAAGTAVFDTSNDTLYIYNGSTWIAK